MERTPLSRRQHNVLTPRRAPASASRDKLSRTAGPTTPLTPGGAGRAPRHTTHPTHNTHNTSDTEQHHISVAVRVRPPSSPAPAPHCLARGGAGELRVRSCPAPAPSVPGAVAARDLKETYLSFTYDHVFWYETGCGQADVFERLAIPLLDSSLEGFNSCLFAYGQTGSGKTYSLMDADGRFSDAGAGIVPRFCRELLRRRHGEEFEIDVGYYEIYHEKIYDLLSAEAAGDGRTSLKVREHPLSGPYVSELTTVRVYTFDEVLGLLKLGNRRRMTGATLNNERSSRSHTIFDISLQKPSHEQTKIRLVDLAGSERVSQCSITEERFKEGLSINKSLLILGKVITALVEKKKRTYIPYRESLLTWLLKDSLGGNSRTCMLATVSPNPSAIEETLSTLRWAHKARSIVCAVTKNEDPQIRLIVELQNEVKRLRALRNDVANKSGHTDTLSELEELQTKIELEKQQKSAEQRLQTELAKLEMHLNEAEKRKSELESQREIILQEASENSIPSYKSNFYDNLKNILDCSMNDSIGDLMKEDVTSQVKSTSQLKEKYLHKMKDLTDCLSSIYKAELSINDHNPSSMIALSFMNEIRDKLNKIIELS